MGDYALIAGGRRLPVSFRVLTWHDTGLEFKGLRTRKETRQFTLHYTGGSGPARQVYRTLQDRVGRMGQKLRLSVHLCVEPDGTVYQFCDLDARCAHAGTIDDSDRDGHELSGNACSVGVEFVNPATVVSDPLIATATSRRVTRAVLREEIHGVELRQTTFTADQIKTLLELVRVVCGHYDLPIAVPMERGDVLARVMTEAEFTEFRGVAGHCNYTGRKRDPGIAPLRAVAALAFRGKDGAAE